MNFSEEILKPDNKKYLDQYLKNCSRNNKSAHTLKNYRADLLKFLIWYEGHFHHPLHKIKGPVIENYKDLLSTGGRYSLLKKDSLLRQICFGFLQIFKGRSKKADNYYQRPLAVSTKKRHLSSIKNFFEYLKQYYEDRNSRFLINPVKEKIHGIKLKDADIEHTPMLYTADWEKLEGNLFRTKERLVAFLLYYTGLRLSELCHLKFEYFDPESRTIKLIRKGGKQHLLGIQNAGEIFYLLKIHRLDVSPSPWLFPSRIPGRSVSSRSMYHTIKKLLKKSGLDPALSPHSFRKACATNLYLKTKDLLYVRDYLNHSDAKVTQTYIDEKSLSASGVFYQ